jgi:hypothetical protein
MQIIVLLLMYLEAWQAEGEPIPEPSEIDEEKDS